MSFFDTNQPAILCPHVRDEDSGLAALKCILMGYGISVNQEAFKQKREELDNPSTRSGHDLDRIAQLAKQVGLEVAVEIHPYDHLLSRTQMPAIVAFGEPPSFFVLWNRIGPFIQVMFFPPQHWGGQKGGAERRWLSEKGLLEQLQAYSLPISTINWPDIAVQWRQPLIERLNALRIQPVQAQAMIKSALAESDTTMPRRLITLDAAIRMVTSMVKEGGIHKGSEAQQLLKSLYEQNLAKLVTNGSSSHAGMIHPTHWSVNPKDEQRLRGVAIMRVLSALKRDNAVEQTEQAKTNDASSDKEDLTPTIEKKSPDEQSVFHYLWQDGLLTPAIIGLAMLLAGGSVLFQSILFRGFMELGLDLAPEQRWQAIIFLLAFAIILFLVRWPLETLMIRLGRALEIRLRIAFFSIIPTLSPHSFFKHVVHKRVNARQRVKAANGTHIASPLGIGNITERIQSVRSVDFLVNFGGRIIWLAAQVLLTVVGIVLIDWASALFALLRALGVLLLSHHLRSLLSQQHKNVRSDVALLSRSYLDVMQGLVAVRTHGAEEAVRYEHDQLLVQWGKSKQTLSDAELWTWSINQLLSYLLMALLLLFYSIRDGDPTNFLLLFYWAFNLDQLMYQLMIIYFIYLRDHTKASRFLNILDAPQERDLWAASSAQSSNDFSRSGPRTTEVVTTLAQGVEIAIKDVTLKTPEQLVLLRKIDLDISAGSKIAIVGPSGAGKSTLVGLLLGWHRPTRGQILIDQQPLTYERLQTLRQQTAWVAPTVQLWNRSFIYNLHYGESQANPSTYPEPVEGEFVEREPENEHHADHPLEEDSVIKQADLSNVLKRLPNGFLTSLGQEGRLLSAGEAQRMRFARAMQRPDARLVILDEPFRGLDRQKRRTLLTRARTFWRHATLICITHDINMTLDFERVLVIENGQLIEDGNPNTLAKQPTSRYHALLAAEKAVQENMYRAASGGTGFKRIWLEEGQLSERFDSKYGPN